MWSSKNRAKKEAGKELGSARPAGREERVHGFVQLLAIFLHFHLAVSNFPFPFLGTFRALQAGTWDVSVDVPGFDVTT